MAKTPAWQRAEGKNPEGGLNEKGRASLRAAGHDIKRPQPEGGSRKDSFCARMKGMKAKLTSSETANDPDSRINKSLRKWKCADGGKVDPYEAMRRLIEEQQEQSRRAKDPMFSIQPEEYRKGNLGLGRYVLANGGRANMALGGDPTALDTSNPVLATPNSVSPDVSYVNSLYQNIMGRQGDQGGIDYWSNQLAQGNMDQNQLLQEFARSNEFQGLYQQDPSKAITSLYRTALGRDPDQGGLDYWTGRAKSGEALDAMTQNFLNSREGQNVSNINQYYQDYTGKVATPEQIQSAQQQLGQGQDWTNFLEKTFPTKPADDGSYDVAGGWQSRATQVPSSSADLMAKLGPIEQKYGLPQGYLMGMMGIESTYGQNQQTPGSSYAGAFQLSPSLIKQYGVTNPYDWTQSANAAAQYAAANRDYFKKTTGRDPTPQELYGLHQQGNAFAYMAKSPEMNAAQVLRQSAPKTYRTLAAAQNAIRGNLPSDMRAKANSMSAQDFMDFYANKYNQKLGGPDQLGQQAISSYYQPATVQTAAATGAQTGSAPVDPRVLYNAQMEKYKTDKAAYDNWLSNYLAGEAMAGRPIVAPSGGMQAPVMPVYNPNLGQTLASQGAGGNIASANMGVSPIQSTMTNPTPSFDPSATAQSWQPQSMQPIVSQAIMPSYYPVPDARGIGNGLGDTSNTGGGGWIGGGGFSSSGPSFGSSGSPASFSGSVSTFSPGGSFADGGAVDPYDDVQRAAKGGAIWDKPRPKKLGKPEPLSPKEKSSAKAMAKAAGRPYPNLVDNMRAARADGGPTDDRAHEFVQEQLKSGEPQVPQYVAENDFPARAARSVEAVDTAASRVNNLLANVAGQSAMRSPEGRSASDIVQSAMPVDPYQAVQQAASQWREGDKLGAAETMAAGMPMQGVVKKVNKYPLAPRDRWYGEANYEETGGKMTAMSPDEFLSQARPLKIDELTRENINDLKSHIISGGELDPLQLYQKGLEDGRHRAIAAKELGIKKVPVINFRANGGQVEGDVQFADDDPYAKVQEAAKLPMMAQNDFAMRMPQPEVRYDTGPQPGEATLKGYDPTIKERIYQGIAGTEERPSPERAQFARGMSQMAEFAPVLGNVMAGQEAQRRGDTKGMLMAALPVPGMATEARMAEAAISPAQEAAREAYQRVLNAQGLYSHAAEAAANLPQAKGSYEQMMAMLKTAGVKPEEMRWSGVEQFAGQPVTREQLVSHFEQNVPKIEETVLGSYQNPYSHRTADEWQAAINRAERAGNFDEAERLTNAWEHFEGYGAAGASGSAKFQQYTIPGGENYREVLLHTPSQKQDLYKQISQAREDRIAAVKEHGSVLKYDDPGLEQERLQKIREATKRENDLRAKLENIAPEYTSSHWDQPNVLGHLRMSDRTSPEGEKILHLEELQSDWGQAGRKQGFETPEIKKRINEINEENNRLKNYYNELKNQYNNIQPRSDGYGLPLERPDSYTPELEAKLKDEMKNTLAKIDQNKINIPKPGLPSAPYVESTKNWVDLGLKRALKEAAEGGYSKMVWTPGEEQAARYKLSKSIDSLSYSPDTNDLIGFKDNKVVFNKEVPPDKLGDYIGKDAAEKIIGSNPYMVNNKQYYRLEGQEMDVGGEGMKSFYDKMVPTRLKELLKKIDPQAKINTDYIKTGDEWPFSVRIASDGENYWLAGNSPYSEGEQRLSGKFSSYADADKQREKLYAGYHKPVHSVEITPKIREAVKKGLPLYAKGGEVVNNADPYDNIQMKAKNFPRARRASN